MSRYFVTDPPVAVPEFDPATVISDGAPNIIYIRARMDVETSGKVKNALFAVDEASQSLELRAGANETALLIHNIVRWEGPDLGQIPCTPENIRKLDPTEPHIALVLEEIAKRNKPKASPNPKSPTANGSTSGGEDGLSAPTSPANDDGPLSRQLATGTPRSPLQSALAGHRSRSGDAIPTTSKNSSSS